MGSIFNEFFNKDKDDRKPGEIVYQNEQPENTESLKLKAEVYGVVQGVGFRYSTTHLAKQLGINGMVRNEQDGSVYIEAEGTQEKMDSFIQELAKGPSPSAKVEKVVIIYDNSIKDYNGFGEHH